MKVILLLALVATAIAGPQPKFPLDWSSLQTESILVHQGRYVLTEDSACCRKSDSCNVQTQFEKGMHYYSATTNQTRFDDQISGQVVVNDFKIKKEMLIDPNTMQCKEYCPLDHNLHPGFLDKNATDLGATTYKGQQVNKWQWEDRALIIFVMETITVLVNQKIDPAAPVFEHDELTPFGQHIGQFESEWENFKGGPQDPKLFAVLNTDKCPMARDCGQFGGIRPTRRLLNKAYELAKADYEKLARNTA
jgi:hypothetical protein